MSFGIGAFPFGIFATNFNLGQNDSSHAHVHGMRGHGTVIHEESAQYTEEQFLRKVKTHFFISLLRLFVIVFSFQTKLLIIFFILGVSLGLFLLHYLVCRVRVFYVL